MTSDQLEGGQRDGCDTKCGQGRDRDTLPTQLRATWGRRWIAIGFRCHKVAALARNMTCAVRQNLHHGGVFDLIRLPGPEDGLHLVMRTADGSRIQRASDSRDDAGESRADHRASHTQLRTQRGSRHGGKCAADNLGGGKIELVALGLLVACLAPGLRLGRTVRQLLVVTHVLIASTRAA